MKSKYLKPKEEEAVDKETNNKKELQDFLLHIVVPSLLFVTFMGVLLYKYNNPTPYTHPIHKVR